MELGFKNKRALVTGAGKGIGRDIAVALHKHGAKTVALDVDQANLDSLKKECPGLEIVTQDLRDWTSTQKAVSKLGHFDLLVNNAGVLAAASFLDFTEEDLDKVLDINFKAAFNVSQVVCREMVKQGKGGAVVFISSLASMITAPGLAAYCSAKSAMDSLARIMAAELGQHKIRVNTVNPCLVHTEMGAVLIGTDTGKSLLDRTPLQRHLDVGDVTACVLFLLSDKAAMINGVSIPIDGGLLTH